MKILVTGFTANYGGVEIFLMNYYRAIKRLDERIVIDIISTSNEPAFKNEVIEMGGKVHVVPSSRHKKQLKKALNKLMSENTYDVFWCNKCDLSDITYLEQAYKNKIPVRILHSHNSNNLFSGVRGKIVDVLHKANKTKAAKYATKHWACSDFAAQWLFPEKIAQGNYEFIPNAVSAEKFKFDASIREKYRKELDIENKLVLGTVGRLSYQKNPEFILEIFNEIHKKNKNAVLLWVGTGELEMNIKYKIAEYNLKDSVKLLGVRHDVSELMQAMDCFLLPSRFEGLPVVAIEAQAAGLAVFAAGDGTTKQTKITEEFKFISLNQAPVKWAEEILKADLKHKDNYDVLLQKNFEINAAAENLLKKLGELRCKSY
ncbi:MAG: glycosyltransferase [Clostridia bacterium]